MKEFQKPFAKTNNGEVKFNLYNGIKTKSVFAFYEFNEDLGGYIIINEKGEKVEFMDCLGNFTKNPTQFAKLFNNYINSTEIGYGDPVFTYYTSLIDFPSKYLINEEVRKIVKNHENYKIQKAYQECGFINLIECLKYKIYVNKIYKQKIQKAKRLMQKVNANNDVDIIYYEL